MRSSILALIAQLIGTFLVILIIFLLNFEIHKLEKSNMDLRMKLNDCGYELREGK